MKDCFVRIPHGKMNFTHKIIKEEMKENVGICES